ncbi:NAD-dependent epimerase/dehydratase family protein [Catellatospora vulcania]|uniref:NAD-dependent epimerase/dehydratase family protein n=1 Tax=Catellatospora vulcania TaxID=1460450 RepID=UPI0012D42168|nr:NAD-dependent epimerase/dehydratase family protein [Catellatospora vulcania]
MNFKDPHETDVLVIGATGYAGGYTAAALARAGYRVAALQRPGGKPVPQQYRPVPGDLADPPSLAAAARGFDIVVQIGRIEGDLESVGAEAIMDTGARLIHTSGADVLGPGHTHEDTVPVPPAVVAWRADVERRVLAGGGMLVRPGLIYGNGGGVVQDMMVPLQERVGAGVYLGRRGIHWPAVHVEDLADLYVLVAQHAAPGTAWNGVTDNVTIDELAAAIAGGHAVCWPADRESPEEIRVIEELYLMDHIVSADKTRRELGWKPIHTSVLDYYRAAVNG